MNRRNVLKIILVCLIACFTIAGIWLTRETSGTDFSLSSVSHSPRGIMGTSTLIICYFDENEPGAATAAGEAAARAEMKLRELEGLLSNWIQASEISQFNAARVNQPFTVSRSTLDVIVAARDAWKATSGAFDATCRPQIELWQQAGETGIFPDEAAIAAARAQSKWEYLEIDAANSALLKRHSGFRLDIGGIAKGYAIDRALDQIRDEPLLMGGVVNVGGDLACFWRGEGVFPNHPRIQDPFGEGNLGAIEVRDGAVCTSGNYARFYVIEDKRYSHIVDPRMGTPAASVPSATVLAPGAMEADIWATALCVLGEDGLRQLPEGYEALLVVGTAANPRYVATDGLKAITRFSPTARF